MNTHLKILGILTLTVGLAVSQSDTTLAAPTSIGNQSGTLSLQERAGANIAARPVTPPISSLFRDVPSLSEHNSVREIRILPYIGAGFGAGYTSELDRTLAPNVPPQHNLNLGGQLGQSMVPNEFQLGIRIPF